MKTPLQKLESHINDRITILIENPMGIPQDRVNMIIRTYTDLLCEMDEYKKQDNCNHLFVSGVCDYCGQFESGY
jgi:hypothetical protein